MFSLQDVKYPSQLVTIKDMFSCFCFVVQQLTKTCLIRYNLALAKQMKSKSSKILSSSNLMFMEAISQYCPCTSQQSCQGMFPAGRPVRPLVLTAVAAPQTNRTRLQGRCYSMPMKWKNRNANFYTHRAKLLVCLRITTQFWCIHKV